MVSCPGRDRTTVTWNAGRLRVTDVRRWPFGCLTLVLVDAAGSPRKVPTRVPAALGRHARIPSGGHRPGDANGRRAADHPRVRGSDPHLRRRKTAVSSHALVLSRGDLLAAGERIGAPLSSWLTAIPPPAPTASPTPSTPWSQPKRHCGEPDLPTAHLDDASREVRLLMDHRDNLVAEIHPRDQPVALARALNSAPDSTLRLGLTKADVTLLDFMDPDRFGGAASKRADAFAGWHPCSDL